MGVIKAIGFPCFTYSEIVLGREDPEGVWSELYDIETECMKNDLNLPINHQLGGTGSTY